MNPNEPMTLTLCETRTVVIDNGKCVSLKITTNKVVFQIVKINLFIRGKFQYILWIFTMKFIKMKHNVKCCDLKMEFVTVKVGITEG